MPVSTAVDPVAATNLAGSVTNAAHDLSMWGMFMQADFLVKSVMLMLLLASFWSWAIIFDKYLSYKSAKQKAEKFENDFWAADALDEFYHRTSKQRHPHPFAKVFLAAMDEWERSKEKFGRGGNGRLSGAGSANVPERVSKVMSVAINRELDHMEHGLGFLATVGSTAPFVGLFGTVWGIMNSFAAIAGSQNTSLAIVAPGIAEALFATAIGLFAAIPAVVAYNKFSSELDKFSGKMEDFSVEFHTLLSRQIDH